MRKGNSRLREANRSRGELGASGEGQERKGIRERVRKGRWWGRCRGSNAGERDTNEPRRLRVLSHGNGSKGVGWRSSETGTVGSEVLEGVTGVVLLPWQVCAGEGGPHGSG